MEEKLPKRKRNRLKNYDYSTPTAYFITVCTEGRRRTLSKIVGAIHESPAPKLTEYGKIVEETIRSLPAHLGVRIDRYVIMPNHLHLIVFVLESEERRAIRESPLQGRSVISKTMGYIKMRASREIRRRFGDVAVWQRSFHDHIIRDRDDYEKIAKYIAENPINWGKDCFYCED